MKIGFIGLGTMGRHMASNLMTAGHDLVVHDVRREAAAPHREAGARWAETPRGVAEATDVIFTSLPGPPEVEAVALGEEGLLAGLKAGKVYFDLTTNAPALVRRIHGVFGARGIHMLDAPVSGGPRGAETRRLALWVGGDEGVFKRYRAVLGAIGDQPHYVGPIGAGSIAKLVHNCAGYVIQTALAEVFTMGVKAGVDPLALWKAVRLGAVGRRSTFDGLVDQHHARRDDRGAQPRLGRARLARRDAPAGGARGRRDLRRRGRDPPGGRTRVTRRRYFTRSFVRYCRSAVPTTSWSGMPCFSAARTMRRLTVGSTHTCIRRLSGFAGLPTRPFSSVVNTLIRNLHVESFEGTVSRIFASGGPLHN
jgi:3-hydroxyisobutyrate dehydrogenase